MARKKTTLSDTLREALKADPRNSTAIAEAAGIALPLLTRFLHGERDLRLKSAEKLADALGLELQKKENSGITH